MLALLRSAYAAASRCCYALRPGDGAVCRGASQCSSNSDQSQNRPLAYTKTDGSGYYTFTSLLIGFYEVKVDEGGFAEAHQKVTLDPSAKARKDFQLNVAGTAATLSVTDMPPEISRDDASIGTVIENQTIISTPLFMRNWDDLIRLVPGVQAQRYTEQSGGTASGRTGGFNIHGIDSLQNNFIMDGIGNNTFSENVQKLSTQSARPSVDVIGEFKLISNPYAAEYGRSPGAVVDVTTKGGTNQVHGLLFEYLRNRVLMRTTSFRTAPVCANQKMCRIRCRSNFSMLIPWLSNWVHTRSSSVPMCAPLCAIFIRTRLLRGERWSSAVSTQVAPIHMPTR